MARWINKLRAHGESPRVDALLSEVAAVCRKHGLSIGHEDTQGGFLVSEYDDELESWLLAASDDRANLDDSPQVPKAVDPKKTP